jgi:Enoyl-(Acyl carrier protein) reductase
VTPSGRPLHSVLRGQAVANDRFSQREPGLHALTRNLALELAQYKIRVNAIAPAVVATPIYERFVPKDKLEQTLHSFDGLHPLGRVGHTQGRGQHDHVPAVPGGGNRGTGARVSPVKALGDTGVPPGHGRRSCSGEQWTCPRRRD